MTGAATNLTDRGGALAYAGVRVAFRDPGGILMTHRFRRLVAASLTFVALVAATAACTITFVPTDVVVDVQRPAVRPAAIERFESVRAIYRVGDRVSFRIATRDAGYVTLTAIDPDGSVYVIARNVPVFGGGRTQVVPGPDARIAFVAVPPTGRHAVRAHFTPRRTSESVVYAGVVGGDAWFARIRLELTGTGYGIEDTAEVRFTIAR